jgi:hypothetical protein
MKIRNIVAMMIVIGVILYSEARANLISNGSFESGLDGWTASRYFDVLGNYGSTDGAYSVEFAFGNAGGSSLSQSVATDAGSTYRIAFDWKATHPGVQSMNVVVDGAIILSITGGYTGPYDTGTPFTHFDGSFVAKGFVTNIGFFDTSPSSFQQDQIMDNVSVTMASTAVPEPSTIALFGLGMAFLFFGLRKRQEVL